MARMSDGTLRQLANLIRFGTVQTVPGKHVQVRSADCSRVPCVGTRRLPNEVLVTAYDRQQVVVLSPNGDLGADVVLGGIFCDAFDVIRRPPAFSSGTI